MKHLFFLTLFSCFSGVLFAQNNFLEVVVTDTVLIQADKFVYRVSVANDIVLDSDTVTSTKANTTNYLVRQQLVKEKQKQALSLIETKIKNAGFSLLPFTISELTSRGYSNSYFQVLANSTDSLALLYLLLKDERNVYCNVTMASSVKETTEQERLFKKIIAQAKKKATMLSGLSGKKVGSIISLSENKSILNERNIIYNQNFIPEDGSSSILIENRKVNSFYSISNSITVKFALL